VSVRKARKRPAGSAGTDRDAVVARDTSSSAPREQGTAAPVAEEEPPGGLVDREDGPTGEQVVPRGHVIRSRIASLVWLASVICALCLAVGALLVALTANGHNGVVSFVLGGADKLDLGVFSRGDGIVTFQGRDAATKDALVNWGIGAIAYLVVGKLLDRVIARSTAEHAHDV
jgi:hypothetical protein